MKLGLEGKRVLITGASRGIGAAAATAFAQEGCELQLVARDLARLQALAQSLESTCGIRATAHAMDLRQPDHVQQLAALSPLPDILVNNAGDIPAGTLDAIGESDWRHAWELKVFGYINLTRLLYARMKAQGHGVIVNVIGVAGERPDARYIAGTTGNSALMGFTRALGGASLADGIRVVGINPGAVATDRIVSLMKSHALSRFGDESRYPEFLQDLPGGRAATPEEIADAMLFLASPRSAYTTGVILTIDGGLSSGRYAT